MQRNRLVQLFTLLLFISGITLFVVYRSAHSKSVHTDNLGLTALNTVMADTPVVAKSSTLRDSILEALKKDSAYRKRFQMMVSSKSATIVTNPIHLDSIRFDSLFIKQRP